MDKKTKLKILVLSIKLSFRIILLSVFLYVYIYKPSYVYMYLGFYQSIFSFGYFNDIKLQYEFLYKHVLYTSLTPRTTKKDIF